MTVLQIQLTTDGEGNVKASLLGIADAAKKVKPATDEAKGGFDSLKESIEGIKKVAEAWGVYEVVKEAIAAFSEANAQARELQDRLIGVTATAQAAADAYEQIGEVAQHSQATSEQLTNSWIRLANVGIKPTVELLQSISNISLVTGQSVDTVANAVAAGTEGSVRALRELGIEVQNIGDQQIVTFQGLPTVIDRTRSSLAEYIEKLGQSSEFIDAQQARLESTGGQWDLLKKKVEDFNVALGGGSSYLGKYLATLSEVVDKWTFLEKNGGSITSVVLGLGPGDNFKPPPTPAQDQQNSQFAAEFTQNIQQQAQALGVDSAAMDVYNNTIGRLLGLMPQLVAEQQAENSARIASQVESAKETDVANKLAATLEQQAQSMGKTAVQSALARIGLGDLATASTDAQGKVLGAAIALDRATEAMKAQAAYKAALAQDQSYIDSIERETAALDGGKESQIVYNEILALSKAANEADRDAIIAATDALLRETAAHTAHQKVLEQEKQEQEQVNKQDAVKNELAKAYEEVLAQLDPKYAALLKYEDEVEKISAGWAAGIRNTDDAIAALGKANDALNTSLANADGAKQWTHVWSDAISDVVKDFNTLLVGGMKDAGAEMVKETSKIAAQIESEWVKQKIVVPLEQGKTPASGDLVTAGAFAVGSIAGTAVGGGGQDAAIGASVGGIVGGIIGTIFPVIGTAIGTFVGSFLGGAIGGLFDSTKTPEVALHGGGGGGTSTFTDDLGPIGISGKHVNDDMVNQLEAKIEGFDDAIAKFLPSSDVDRVKAALASINKDYVGISLDAIEADRLDAIMSVVNPQFKTFIDSLSGVQQRAQAFESIIGIQKEIGALADVITTLAGSPVDQIVQQMKQLDQADADARDMLNTALETRDPTQIITAENTLKAAILNRYATEIQLVQNLVAQLTALDTASDALNLSIAQKMAALNGDPSAATNVALGNLNDVQGRVNGDTDPGQALNDLNTFTSAVDTWLQAADAQVNEMIQSQMDALEAQRTSLENERADIDADATARQTARQTERTYEDGVRKDTVAAMQKQLTLAQQWASVLDNAQKLIQNLTTGTSNPLGAFSQLDNVESIISGLFAKVQSESGAKQATDANTLLQDLQQRLQTIQSGNLYDRSSPQYLQAYNQTLSQISQVSGLAQPAASQVDLLTQQIALLSSIQSYDYTGLQYTQDEKNKLDAINTQEAAINKQEADLKAQQQKQLDDIKTQALAYYTWEQTQAQANEQKRHDQLMAQLNAITGGVDPTQFIADETSKEVAILTSIDDQLKSFLQQISSGGTSTGNNGGNGSGNGDGNGPGVPGKGTQPRSTGDSSSVAPTMVNVSVTVNGTGMGSQDVAAAVRAELPNAIAAGASMIKRTLRVA